MKKWEVWKDNGSSVFLFVTFDLYPHIEGASVGDTVVYAHRYENYPNHDNGTENLLDDIRALNLDGADTDTWDGNDLFECPFIYGEVTDNRESMLLCEGTVYDGV